MSARTGSRVHAQQGAAAMPIKVLELHHHGVRIGPAAEAVAEARRFYVDVLGIPVDAGRPDIPGVPGLWLDVGRAGQSAQIHLMGAAGKSPPARSDREDPTLPHVALAVEDIAEARRELDAQGVPYWSIDGLVGADSQQIFLRDPFDNVIELHQVGACRCNRAARGEPGSDPRP